MTDSNLLTGSESGSSWISSLLLWLIILLLVLIGYWASITDVDNVIRANATVISSNRTQVIQSVDGGVIKELTVKEGDSVNKGQKLAKFEDTRNKSYLAETEAKRAGLLANLARLEAELNEKQLLFPAEVLKYPMIINAQRNLYNGRRVNLETDLISLRESVRLANEELKMTERLHTNGDASNVEVLKTQRQVAEAKSKLDNRRNQYIQDVNAERSKSRDELEQVEQQSNQRKQQIVNTIIYSPMDGIVKNVRFTTSNAVLKAGDELLTIVPIDEDLIIEAKVSPRDIGFMKTGLDAMIKFDSYDYTVFGSVNGKVVYISPDSMKEETQTSDPSTQFYYRVHILCKSQAITHINKNINLIPGMTATVDIRLGQRSVTEFLLKPLIKTMNEAFRER